MAKIESPRLRVFVSYSHADRRWLDRLKVHLTPLWQGYDVDVWEDSRLKPGSKWRDEIRIALERANVAILIISADFLASDFVRTNELPPLLKAAEEEGVLILPIIVSPSLFLRNTDLSQFQAVNSPAAPLISVSEGNQEATFLRVAEVILERAVSRSQPEADVQAPDVSINETFLRPEIWTRLIKIGDWIFDRDGDRIIGAGMQAYLLSRSEFGSTPFRVQTSLEFTNMAYSAAGSLGMNAGLIFGWKEEEQVHRYYNVLLTGREVLVERIGFNGGDDYSDFEHITDGAPFVIDPAVPINLTVSVDEERVTIFSGKKEIESVKRPLGVVGRVGLRPWRSKVDITRFVVAAHNDLHIRSRGSGA